jgi:lipopolysaccharide transport system permease protein
MAQFDRLLPVREGHLGDTLGALVGRELRMRYKGSFFGILWAVLTPLATAVILQFLFTKLLKFSIPHFAAFLYSGLLPWTWFQSTLQTGATTLLENRDLVRTPFFAKPLLPGAVTCTNFLMYVLALPILLGLMAADGLPFTPALAALPAVWIAQGILILGFTLLIASLGVLVRDMAHLMVVILTFWFYLTPIFYDLNQIPIESSRWLAFNPMAAIITAHRAVTIRGQLPDWLALGYVTLFSAALLAVSIFVFRMLEDAFIDEV